MLETTKNFIYQLQMSSFVSIHPRGQGFLWQTFFFLHFDAYYGQMAQKIIVTVP